MPINQETKNVGNSQVQKWYKSCGVPAVILTVFSFVFCTIMYKDKKTAETQMLTERQEHAEDLKENTLFIQSLITTTTK